jgi:hypothetical protein
MLGVMIISIVIMLTLPWNVLFRLIGSILIAYYGSYLIWQYGLLKANTSVYRITWQRDEQWLIYTRQAVYEAELRGDSTLTTWASVLRFRVPGYYLPISCVICFDAMPADYYRKLLFYTLSTGILSRS